MAGRLFDDIEIKNCYQVLEQSEKPLSLFEVNE